MRRTVSAIALCALAGPAFAEVDAAELWEDLRTGAEAWGYTVDAGAVDIGDTEVTVTDLTFSFASETSVPAEDDPLLPPSGETGDDAGAAPVTVTTDIVFTLPTLRIVEDGEAAVIELPAAMPFEVTGTSAEGAGNSLFGGTLGQEGMRITVTEDGDAKLYDYTAGAITANVDRFEGPDVPDEIDVAVRMEDVTGRSRVSENADGHRVSEQSSQAARLTVSANVTDGGDNPGDFALAMAVADVSGGGTAVLPEDIDMNDMAAALAAGLDIQSSLTLGAGHTEMEFTSPEGNFSYAANSNGGGIEVALAPDTLRYGITSDGGDVSIVGSNIPVPELSYSVESGRMIVTLPPLGSDEPQSFGVDVALRGVEISESLWSLFDPEAVLPREPASIVLDMTGTALFPQGLMDLTGGATPSTTPPEVSEIEIQSLELSLAGAALLGRASFTGTPGGMPMAPGLPPLQGTAELSVTGLNALMDGLTQLGLVPPQQGAMVRGMLGFIARPTGDDSYATEIELGPNGITANGVPLQ